MSSDELEALKFALITAGGILLPLSLAVFAYERALIPIYASIPTAFFLDKVLLFAIILAFLNPFQLRNSRIWLFSVALVLAPNATYWVPVWTARWKDPYWGPVIVHAGVLFPLAFSYGSLVKFSTTKLGSVSGGISLRVVAAFALSYVSVLLSRKIWANATLLKDISDSQIFLVQAAVAVSAGIGQLDISTASPAPKTGKGNKSRKPIPASTTSPFQVKSLLLAVFLGLWLSFSNKLHSPVLPHPYPTTGETPKTLTKGPIKPPGLPFKHPSYPLVIHSSVQSTTGLIVVGEALENPDNTTAIHSVRYLRAAHSILGGLWVGSNVATLDDEPPIRDARGRPLGDSIYGAFVLQEAARLVDSTGKSASEEDWKNALIIGLGVGVSATAFHRHNMNLTVVEIDPAVYNAARRYFGLPDPGPGNIFLEDARGWAATKRARVDSGMQEVSYDIVVHDCFSGGGVPEQLYSVEFWNDLKKVVSPDGVVAVNFAGKINSKPSRLVLLTLETVFGSCRAFHDSMDRVPEEKYEDDFVNLVFFCTLSSEPLTFRRTFMKDFLGSPLRRHMLTTLANREINLDVLRSSYEEDTDLAVLSDGNNPLGKLQEEQGFHHWQLMRQVLPDVFWETF